MPAVFDRTRIVAANRPQEAIQPTQGPKARVAQVKVVPESGMARLRAMYPRATRYMGMNPTIKMAGS